MANYLINGTGTVLRDAIDSVLRAMYSVGSDSYEYGKKYISSRAKTEDGNTEYKLTSISSSNLLLNGKSGNTHGENRGILPFILNSDITSDKFETLRYNPACNFADGTVKDDVLIAYAGHNNLVNDDDAKYGYIQIPNIPIEGAGRNHTFKQLIFTSGHAVGTHKQLVTGIDVRGDITSGVSVSRTYYTKHGWPCNVPGITGEYEITDGNSYKINTINGARTEIPADSPLKSIEYPAYFGDVVELGDYIYFIDSNNYINKIDKNTLALVSKSSSTFSATTYNLLKINGALYLCYKKASTEAVLYTVNTDTLKNSSATITNIVQNVPAYMQYSGKPYYYLTVHNVGDYYIVYNENKYFGLACSDLSDVAGTVIPELCQFNVPRGSFRKLTDTVACLTSYNQIVNDLIEETNDILKICMDNGQILSVAEWQTPFENTGNKEIIVTIAE